MRFNKNIINEHVSDYQYYIIHIRNFKKMNAIDLQALKKITDKIKQTLDKFPVKHGQKSSANLSGPQYDTSYFQLSTQTDSFREVINNTKTLDQTEPYEHIPPPKKIEAKFINIRYNIFVNAEIPRIEKQKYPFCGAIQPAIDSKPPLGQFVVAIIDCKPQFGMIGANTLSERYQFYNVSIMKGHVSLLPKDICYFPILYPTVFDQDYEYPHGQEVFVLMNLENQADIRILLGTVTKTPSENKSTQYTIQLTNGEATNVEARFITSIYSPHNENKNPKLFDKLKRESTSGAFKNKFNVEDLLFEPPNSPPPQIHPNVKWGMQEYYPFPQARSGRLSKKAAENVRIARALFKAGESENTTYNFVLENPSEASEESAPPEREEPEPPRPIEKIKVELKKLKKKKKSKSQIRIAKLKEPQNDSETTTENQIPENQENTISENTQNQTDNQQNTAVGNTEIPTENNEQENQQNTDQITTETDQTTEENKQIDLNQSLHQLSLTSLLNDIPDHNNSENNQQQPANESQTSNENPFTNIQSIIVHKENEENTNQPQTETPTVILIPQQDSETKQNPQVLIHDQQSSKNDELKEESANSTPKFTTAAKTLFVPKKSANQQDKEESPKKYRITIRVNQNN